MRRALTDLAVEGARLWVLVALAFALVGLAHLTSGCASQQRVTAEQAHVVCGPHAETVRSGGRWYCRPVAETRR